MNYKIHRICIDLINTLLQFMLVYLPLSVVLHFIDPASALHMLALLPAPFISYAVKKCTKSFWSFMLLHAILIIAYALLTSNLLVKALYLTYLTILTIVSYYNKNKVLYQRNTTIFYILIIFITYLGCQLFHMTDMLTLCFSLGIAYTMLFLLNMYLLNLDRFVREHSHITNVPYQQIKNSNNVLVVFLSGLFLLAMLFFSQLPLGNNLTAVGRFLLRIIRYLFSLIHFNQQDNEMAEALVPEEAVQPEELPVQDSSYLMELLSKIIEWLINILALAGIVCLLLYAIYKIYKYFYLKSGEVVQDKVEFISPFIKSERLKRAGKQKLRTIFGHTNNDTIRKYFFKAVSSNTASRSGLAQSLTPSELSEYALGKTEGMEATASDNNEESQLLTSYYEKARYSNEECSKEEVQSVKNILKKSK